MKISNKRIVSFAMIIGLSLFLLSGCQQVNNLVNGNTTANQANTNTANSNTAQVVKNDLLGTWISTADANAKVVFTEDEMTFFQNNRELNKSKYKRLNEQEIEVMAQATGKAIQLKATIAGDELTLESNGKTDKFKRGSGGATAINTDTTASPGSDNSQTFKNSIGMEFVEIRAGSFTMGSANGGRDEKPVHQVTITKSFGMGKTEVTQEQWQAVMGGNPSEFKKCPKCPVENVAWEEAQEFIRKLNERGEGAYRLPTEAEWEYAARAGTTGDHAGDLDGMAWYGEPGGKTHEVGTKQANAWGLYDMHGNVWEWCADGFEAYPSGEVTDPTGASSGSYHVIRGGSWSDDAWVLRSAKRDYVSLSYRNNGLGFRVVRT